jgi:hypothetical protein
MATAKLISPNNRKQKMKRQDVERKIARKIIEDAIAAGYTIDVFDGEDYPLKDSADVEAILGAMFSTDDDRLYLCKGKSVGWVWLIYGNSGWDVISDHTISIEDVLQGAVKLSEEMEDDVDVRPRLHQIRRI